MEETKEMIVEPTIVEFEDDVYVGESGDLASIKANAGIPTSIMIVAGATVIGAMGVIVTNAAKKIGLIDKIKSKIGKKDRVVVIESQPEVVEETEEDE